MAAKERRFIAGGYPRTLNYSIHQRNQMLALLNKSHGKRSAS
jgi:hypothetical protein